MRLPSLASDRVDLVFAFEALNFRFSMFRKTRRVKAKSDTPRDPFRYEASVALLRALEHRK